MLRSNTKITVLNLYLYTHLVPGCHSGFASHGQTSQFFDKHTRRSWPSFFLPTPNQRGHSKSPFTPLIPKLNLMKILSCGISPNTSELLAPESLKEFAWRLIAAKPAFRGTTNQVQSGKRCSIVIQSTQTLTPR
jgi:hypothetical protein